MKPAKKSQTTIFMIIGLVIIIGGGIFFYSIPKTQTQFEPEIKIVQEQVPIEFDPIKKYGNDCAYSVAVEGLKLIGKQGGYTGFSKNSFTITQNPTESDAVYFTGDSGLKVPYWWYLKSANNCRSDCVFASKMPELRQTQNSIEKQLEGYISAKFSECTKKFEPFAEQGFKIEETGKISTDVTIASDDIFVLVEQPLSIDRQGAKREMKQFTSSIPLDLENIYELGAKITNLEINHHFIEKHVLNLVAAFSGIDREKLPPMSDLQFKFGSKLSWHKTDIKNKITAMLTSYIPLFHVDGTYNYERNFLDSELKQRLYDSTILPVANSSFEKLSASFAYLDFWPAYFDLNCKGEICRPSSANSLISIIGLQNYKFNYDISFPVLVEIQDPFALNEQGYTFNFFLEGNIRNNEFMPGDFAPLEFSTASERSQLCDIRTSGNITVNVADAVSKKPAEEAQVLYTLTGESCFIGETGASGIVKEQFPVGIGGAVNIVKDGYIGKAAEFDAKADLDSSLNAELQPIYTKNVVVKKKRMVKTLEGWQFDNTPVELSEKEQATISLTRIKDESELDFSSVANYEGKQKEKSEIEIAAGDYSADINLLLNEKIVIPAGKKCGGFWPFKKCQDIPAIDFSEGSGEGSELFTEGGLKMDFTIKPEDLEKHGTIVLYVISIDLANVPEQERTLEDVEQIGKTEEYSSIYQVALQPEYTE